MVNRRRINLIPKSRRVAISLPVDQILVVGATVVIVLCLGLGVFQLTEKRSYQNSYASLLNQEKQINQQLALLETVKTTDKQRAARRNLIKNITGNQLPWADMFKELSLLVPKDTWLTELLMQNQSGQLAVSLKGEAVSQSRMAQFFSVLESSDYYRNVLVKYSESFKAWRHHFPFMGLNLPRST
ncbi:MAG: PilN domain-containing protein [Bdellovibrionales bacterium]